MEKSKENTVSIRLIKEGKNPKNWIEMTSVNDIYKQALLLDKKGRKKLLKGFRDMMEVAVNYKKACDAMVENGDSGLDVTVFKWCDD